MSLICILVQASSSSCRTRIFGLSHTGLPNQQGKGSCLESELGYSSVSILTFLSTLHKFSTWSSSLNSTLKLQNMSIWNTFYIVWNTCIYVRISHFQQKVLSWRLLYRVLKEDYLVQWTKYYQLLQKSWGRSLPNWIWTSLQILHFGAVSWSHSSAYWEKPIVYLKVLTLTVTRFLPGNMSGLITTVRWCWYLLVGPRLISLGIEIL